MTLLGCPSLNEVKVIRNNFLNDFRASPTINPGRTKWGPVRDLRQRDELRQRGQKLQQRQGHTARHQQPAGRRRHRILP